MKANAIVIYHFGLKKWFLDLEAPETIIPYIHITPKYAVKLIRSLELKKQNCSTIYFFYETDISPIKFREYR